MTRRIVSGLDALQTWQTIPALCARLRVHRRTVYRLLADFQHAGVDVERRLKGRRAEYRRARKVR